MPKIAGIDPKSKEETRRFIADGTNLRLQLKAKPDAADPLTGRRILGETQALVFEDNVLITNRKDWIEGVLNSYAWQNGQIRDLDVIERKAKEARREELLNMAKNDPEFLKAVAELTKEPQPSGVSSFGKGSRS